MNIKRKILIPMISLTIGCCAVILLSSILLFNRELNNAMYDKINVAAMVAEHEIANLKTNAHIAALGIATNPDLIEALKYGDRDRINTTTTALQVLAQIDYCTILDSKGIVLFRSHEPEIYGDSLIHLPHVRQAINGNTETYVAQGVTIRLGAYAGSPIYDSNMDMIGIVSLGFRLDTQEFVYRLNDLTGCEITIFLNEERVSSTIQNEDGTYVLGTRAPEEVGNIVLSGESYFGKIQLFGNDVLTKYSPLYGAVDEIVGMVFVGYYTAEDTGKVLFFILSGALITLVVLIICIIIARFVSGVIEHRLENMMREVHEADEAANKAIAEKNTLSNLGDIMNGLDTMIYVTDPITNEILFMNNTMKQHYGIEGDCVGQLCYRLLQKNHGSKCSFCPCFQLEKEPEKTIFWEEHSSLTNNIYRNVDRYIKWSNGKTVHIQHSVDMTELINAKNFAEQSSHYKSAFLAIMSHEIRTPMNTILGVTEIQLRDEILSPETEEAFEKIYESGDLLLNIINDILDLSKIEAGKLELSPVKYDIPSLINDTAQLIRLRYESKAIDLILHVDENTPLELYGDELRIKQVLNNILSNAFKYTERGNVKFSVSSENEKNENVTIVFSISDTGQGMTEDQIEKLFDEYTRFNIEANRTTVGTGLGMSITHRLIKFMNGSINVESKPGNGTLFTVRVPQIRMGSAVCGPELADNLKKFRFQSNAINKKTQFIREYMPYGSVLVVDDVESNLYVAKGMLAPYGLKIETASSGFEAVEKIKAGNVYDILLMDHMMPIMDGIEAVKIIRDGGYNHCILALTANALIGCEEMFLKNGFNGFISKPIDSRELNFLLNEFIRNKKPPEIVDAARREQREEKFRKATVEQNVSKSPDLIASFLRDALNAINVLENMSNKLNALSDDEVYMYIITVHGMKSALANVDEKELSGIAFKLELAGKDRNFTVMSDETPSFINSLKSLITKYKPEDEINDTDISNDDLLYLNDSLLNIKTACEALNKQAVKIILNSLRQKKWPDHINSALESISVHLLHSEFDTAANIAFDTMKINV